MSARLDVDLESGVTISRLLPDLDLLDIAYGAARGGAGALVVPLGAFVGPQAMAVDLFNRSGLPLLIVKCEAGDLDRIPGLGSTPDRVLVTADRGRPNPDMSKITDMISRLSASGQEVAVYVDPEPALLKDAARAKCRWVFFPSEHAYRAENSAAAEAELARITSAALAANRLGLRAGVMGLMGRHLPSALAAIPNLEELCPGSDLWCLAIRCGWEGAVEDFRRMMS